MQRLFIVGAKRTPFGTFGGALKDVTASSLAVTATRAALEQANVSPKLVDSVIVGNVQQVCNHYFSSSFHQCSFPLLIYNSLSNT
jgi:acetyl-CoA acetyltransferase